MTLTQQFSSDSATQNDDSDSSLGSVIDKDDDSPVQEALRQAQERWLNHFIEQEAPAWLSSSSIASLPFACTECGNCCRTRGSVYLSPDEVVTAAELLDITPQSFVDTYTSHVLGGRIADDQTSATTTDSPAMFEEGHTWVRLQERQGACVFLDDTTNYCGIYEARPVQCRTYPFWPKILKSPTAWNAECRWPTAADEEDDTKSINQQDVHSTEGKLPRWTYETGGCEGMRLLSSTTTGSRLRDDNGDGKASSPSKNSSDGVPLREACRDLLEYELSSSRFPFGQTEKPVVLEQKQHHESS